MLSKTQFVRDRSEWFFSLKKDYPLPQIIADKLEKTIRTNQGSEWLEEKFNNENGINCFTHLSCNLYHLEDEIKFVWETIFSPSKEESDSCAFHASLQHSIETENEVIHSRWRNLSLWFHYISTPFQSLAQKEFQLMVCNINKF